MAINLARLPFPDVIQSLDYEAILRELVSEFKQLWKSIREDNQSLPAYDVDILESDPVMIVLQAFAYRELLLRSRVNGAAKALMLATTSGTDLDHFAADFDMERLVVSKDTDGNPIYESDEAFRLRRQLAPDGYAAAGPENAYKFFSLSADGRIRQVEAIKGDDNRCDVVLLGRDGDGSVEQEIVAKVYEALSAKTRRPLTDNVYVRSVSVTTQPIKVHIKLQTGPDPETIAAKSKASIEAYARERSAIGTILRVDGIIGAAHAGNSLESVTVIDPPSDVDPGKFGTVYVPEVIVEVI